MPDSATPPVPAQLLPQLAIVGRVRRTHGLKGDMAVEPYTDAPDVIFASGARVFMGVTTGPEPKLLRECTVGKSTPVGKGILLHLDGVEHVDAADQLRDRFFFVPLDELSPPLEEEIFRHELIGMQVATTNGVALGEVAGWFEMPQGVMLEVKGEKDTLIPYREEFIRVVDAEERRITVELPEGFFD
ncbi:MAG: ribosome maturation factor RimM [Gemmatimonadaceae bacterium]